MKSPLKASTHRSPSKLNHSVSYDDSTTTANSTSSSTFKDQLRDIDALIQDFHLERDSRLRSLRLQESSRLASFEAKTLASKEGIDPRILGMTMRVFLQTYGGEREEALKDLMKGQIGKQEMGSAERATRKRAHPGGSPSRPRPPTSSTNATSVPLSNNPSASSTSSSIFGPSKKPRLPPSNSNPPAPASATKPRIPSSSRARQQRQPPTPSTSTNTLGRVLSPSPSREIQMGSRDPLSPNPDDWDLMDRNEASRVESLGRGLPPPLRSNSNPKTAGGQGHGRVPSGAFTYEAPAELNDEYFRLLQKDLVRRMRETLECGEMSRSERGKLEKRLEVLTRSL
ncbi:hypothetical protein P7C70_g7742, partial [Phenoliferia sp. Uapishka_3]